MVYLPSAHQLSLPADRAAADVIHSLIVNPIDLMHVAAERQLDARVAEEKVLELLDVGDDPVVRYATYLPWE